MTKRTMEMYLAAKESGKLSVKNKVQQWDKSRGYTGYAGQNGY